MTGLQCGMYIAILCLVIDELEFLDITLNCLMVETTRVNEYDVIVTSNTFYTKYFVKVEQTFFIKHIKIGTSAESVSNLLIARNVYACLYHWCTAVPAARFPIPRG